MQTRQLMIGVLAIVVLGGGYLLWSASGSGPQTYGSQFVGLEFTYPAGYVIEEHVEENGPQTWHIVLLTPEENLPAPQNSEGPPSIIMIAFDNVQNQTAEQWVRSSAASNFNLSDEELTQTVIGGRDAVIYRYSGLYENDAAVVTTERKVYFFSAGWLTEEDVIRQDFSEVLSSVRFLQ